MPVNCFVARWPALILRSCAAVSVLPLAAVREALDERVWLL